MLAGAAAVGAGDSMSAGKATGSCGKVSSRALQPPATIEGSGPAAALGELAAEAVAAEARREDALLRASEALRDVFGPAVQMVKATSVGGRMVYVVDGAMKDPVREHLYQCLQTDAFRRTEFARPDTQQFRHSIVEYSVDHMSRTDLFRIVCDLVELLFGSQQATPLQVYRIYTNAVMYGDAAFVHRDSCEPEHVTAIVYPNPDWAPELGGETLFYDEAGLIAEAVEPKPGRIVAFRGCVMHKGSPPSRLFWGSRFTTAFKFAPPDFTRASAGGSPPTM